MAPSDSKEDWQKLCEGPEGEVWILQVCLKEMDALPTKDHAKIRATMEEMFCQFEDLSLIPTDRLNRNEHRHKLGHKEYRVQAFKCNDGGGRVYGVQGSMNGNRAFFATCAAVKKKDKADPKNLKRAVERLEGLADVLSGARL